MNNTVYINSIIKNNCEIGDFL